jgi:3-deoxy-D-manno-octulosonate 8-phosphate phosphatase (KDO 8-P phosphatase)
MDGRDLPARARAVRLLILDVDGVLTDGSLYFGAQGEEMKRFDVRDGHGLRMLADAGLSVAIVSGRRSEAVERRAEGLGILAVLQGVTDKLAAGRELAQQLGLRLEECAAAGDDLPDLPLLRRVGLAVTVPGAPAAVRAAAHYVTEREGGRGAVRELSDLLLNAQGRLEGLLARYLG